MSLTRTIILVIFQIIYCFSGNTVFATYSIQNNSASNNSAVAVNDTFVFLTGCNNDLLSGCVISNDFISDNSNASVCYIFAPDFGTLSFGTGGKFVFTIDKEYSGEVNFRYRVCDNNKSNEYSEAEVLIIVKRDNDCDNIDDITDLDDDNDGILDLHEGDGLIDTDKDGIPDSFDIDSDNDGITDIEEWQTEGMYVQPSGIDRNENGWDDVFDSAMGGSYYEHEDTNNNGVPDYLDSDSDGDGLSDNIEAYDTDFDGKPELLMLNKDTDNDGLDDGYDIIIKGADGSNSFGCSSPLPDENNNGIRNWREAYIIPIPGKKNPISRIESEFLFYPNPSSGTFTVNISDYTDIEEFKIQIFNLNGVLLLDNQITQSNLLVNAKDLLPGLYLVRIKSPAFDQTERLKIIP